MTCRRKLKRERELYADIRKCFNNFCKNRNCKECEYSDDKDCMKSYVLDLLKKYYEDDEEEE